MTWPVYPHETDEPALTRHKAHMAGKSPPRGRQGSFGAALDVWRDGAHLWRSYGPDEATMLDDWHHDRWYHEFGTMYPRDYDSGPWRAPGVILAPDSLIPTREALRWVGGVPAVCDLMATALAIGQLPRAPDGKGDVPSPGALYAELHRDAEGWIVRTAEADGVTVRALIAPCDPPEGEEARDDEETGPLWLATLERREVRAGAALTALPEGEAVFHAPPDTPPHILARRAKAALGISGQQAQRQPDELVWITSRAPYRMTVSLLTGEGVTR